MLGAVVAAAMILTGAMTQASPQTLMDWPDLLGRPKPALRPERLRYGADSNQVIDLWRPTTPGPHPVIAMIHGGCWQASIASLHIMDWAAADLAKRGVAVWNIEYRRADQPGGGYPGTYRDVTAALEKLNAEAAQRQLSTGAGLVVLGHSAGGQLALWAAGQARLVRQGPLTSVSFPRIAAVVDLAGVADLEHDISTGCGPDVVAQMAGAPPAYPYTSPAHMLPLQADLHIIHGAQDTTVPPEVGDRFAAKARAAGDRVTVSHPPGGHVEEIAPGSAAWEETIAPLVLKLVGATK